MAEQSSLPSREVNPEKNVESKDLPTEQKSSLGLLHDDPLNVHQMILKHLKISARAPITTVYELANLITNSCANIFDQHQVPDEFQFLDFFERSIGNVVSQQLSS